MKRKSKKKEEFGERILEVMEKAGWYNQWLFSWIEKDIGNKVLEVGAGIGTFTNFLLKICRDLTAIDVNNNYLRILRKKFAKARIGFGDIEQGKYFFNRDKFHTIVCLNVLEHIEKDEKALKNMFDLLYPKGKLILLVPAHQFLFSGFDKELGHFRRYSLKDIRQKLQKIGFGKITLCYLNWFGALGWFFWFKLIRLKKMPKKPVKFFDFLGRFFLFPERLVKPPFGLSILAIAEK